MTKRIKKCSHCNGTGICIQGKTTGMIIEVVHSCNYCVKKSSIKPDGLFPKVPCGYCPEEKKEAKPQEPKQNQTSIGGKYVRK